MANSIIRACIALGVCGLHQQGDAALTTLARGVTIQDSALMPQSVGSLESGTKAIVCSVSGYIYVAACYVTTAITGNPGEDFEIAAKLNDVEDSPQTRGIVALSADKALMCYAGCKRQSGTSACGSGSTNACVLVTANGNTLAFGTPYSLTQGGGTGLWKAVGVGALSSTTAMVCGKYTTPFSTIFCTVVTLAGSSLSAGIFVEVYKTGSNDALSVTALTDSLAIICYPRVNTAHLACAKLSVSEGAITLGPESAPRGDSGQVAVASPAGARLSSSVMILCYSYKTQEDEKTLCSFLSFGTSDSVVVLAETSYQIATTSSLHVSVAAISEVDAIVCYKKKATATTYVDECVDVHLYTGDQCNIGSPAWTSGRGSFPNTAVEVVGFNASTTDAMVCSGGSGDAACDIVRVESAGARSACTKHTPLEYCDPEGGGCNSNSGTSSGVSSGNGNSGGLNVAAVGRCSINSIANIILVLVGMSLLM